MQIRNISLAATTVIAATLMGVPTASPAAAANTCGANHVCAYNGNNYTGREFFDERSYPGKKHEALNDRINSVSNRTDWNMCVMDWDGVIVIIPPHSGVRSLGDHNNTADYVLGEDDTICDGR